MPRRAEDGGAVARAGAENIVPDAAAAFLAEFTGRHTFQTFDDRPGKAGWLAGVHHTPADLQRLNRQGAGVFVMVNEGNGAGRTNESVTRIRAYFADFDGQPLPRSWPLMPSLVVESSPARYHAYWILQDGEHPPLDGPAFNRQQETIARMVGSCPDDCKGLARVMSLPGFIHQKGEPFETLLLLTTGRRYTLAEITDAFPIPRAARVPQPAAAPINPPRALVGALAGGVEDERRRHALNYLYDAARALATMGQGGRNTALNAAAYRAGQLVGGGHLNEGEARQMLQDAAERAGLSTGEIARTLPRALQDGQDNPDALGWIRPFGGHRGPVIGRHNLSEGERDRGSFDYLWTPLPQKKKTSDTYKNISGHQSPYIRANLSAKRKKL